MPADPKAAAPAGRASSFETQHVGGPQPAAPVTPVAASGSVGFNGVGRVDPPTFVGRVISVDHRVQFELSDGTRLDLASSPKDHIYASRWGGEAGSFVGLPAVQVRGFLDDSKKVLHAEELIPGAGKAAAGVHGRITLGPEGEVLVRVHEGRKYRVEDKRMADILRNWQRVAFILPGDAQVRGEGAARVHAFRGGQNGVYLLTLLNPGLEDGFAFFDTPFEKVAVALPPGGIPPESMGRRIFVYGEPTTADDALFKGKDFPGIKRFFKMQWVGEPIDSKAVKAAAELGEKLGLESDATQVLNTAAGYQRSLEASPAWKTEVPFAPGDLKSLAGTPVPAGVNQRVGGLKHGKWETTLDGKPSLENWYEGRKLSAGPIDAQGRPHGVWTEFTARPSSGRGAAGEGPFTYVASLKGPYENGVRSGSWTLLRDGQPSNFWDYRTGKVLRSGSLNAEGLPEGAFRFTAAPDHALDGGEGEYVNGKVVGFEYLYKPGTSEYGYVKQHDDQGRVIAEGPTRKWVVPWRDIPYFVRDGEWKLDGKTTRYGANDYFRLEGEKIEIPDQYLAIFG